MRHRINGKKLNRDSQHRRALQKNLISALILEGQIKTTFAKAKFIQPEVDKLLTLAKKGTVAHRRQIDATLNRTKLVNKLVDEIAPATGERNSGFTRIVRLGTRRGDNAMIARLEWVDTVTKSEEIKPKKATKKAKTTSPKKTDKPVKSKSAAKKTKQSKPEAKKK